jgi:hypothetical protein
LTKGWPFRPKSPRLYSDNFEQATSSRHQLLMVPWLPRLIMRHLLKPQLPYSGDPKTRQVVRVCSRPRSRAPLGLYAEVEGYLPISKGGPLQGSPRLLQRVSMQSTSLAQ